MFTSAETHSVNFTGEQTGKESYHKHWFLDNLTEIILDPKHDPHMLKFKLVQKKVLHLQMSDMNSNEGNLF